MLFQGYFPCVNQPVAVGTQQGTFVCLFYELFNTPLTGLDVKLFLSRIKVVKVKNRVVTLKSAASTLITMSLHEEFFLCDCLLNLIVGKTLLASVHPRAVLVGRC